MHRHGELGRPPGDVVVQAAAPAPLVPEGSLVEGSDVAVRWHIRSPADDPDTENVTWQADPAASSRPKPAKPSFPHDRSRTADRQFYLMLDAGPG